MRQDITSVKHVRWISIEGSKRKEVTSISLGPGGSGDDGTEDSLIYSTNYQRSLQLNRLANDEDQLRRDGNKFPPNLK